MAKDRQLREIQAGDEVKIDDTSYACYADIDTKELMALRGSGRQYDLYTVICTDTKFPTNSSLSTSVPHNDTMLISKVNGGVVFTQSRFLSLTGCPCCGRKF